MAISEREKEQLRTILAKMEGIELVRLGGMVYDSIRKAGLPTDKLLVLGKFIYAGYIWANLPKEINDIRLMLVRSVEENVLKLLPDVFNIVPESEQQPAQEETSTPVSDEKKNIVEEAMQAAPALNDPTAGMESVPGGDTEIAPPSSEAEKTDTTSAAIEEIADEDDSDDPLAGIGDEEEDDGDNGEEEIAASPAEPPPPAAAEQQPEAQKPAPEAPTS